MTDNNDPKQMIDGFCTTSRPPQQGSGFYRSASDNYNLTIKYNAPFVTCNSDSLPSGNSAPLTESLDQALCGASACKYDEDTPECDRQARVSTEYFVKLKGQNYGSGGRPRCASVVVCCQSPCCDPSETRLTQLPG